MNRDFSSEMEVKYSRSSGPGGQHVNKTNSRVQVIFSVQGSKLLSEEEKAIILERLSARINTEGALQVVSEAGRSQRKNFEDAVSRMNSLLMQALKPQKKRKPTKPTKASREKRMLQKKLKSGIKESRRMRDF